MLQFIPLLIEIIILAVVAYMYWRIRQLMAEARTQASSAEPEEYSGDAREVWHVEVMHEVANLLTEWQAAASSAREDGLRQQADLQESLRQAETTIAELRTLLTQVQTQNVSDVKLQENKAAPPSISSSLPPTVSVEPQVVAAPRLNSDTWSGALAAFSAQLQADGYSQSTVSRTLGHVRQFAAWLSGPLYAELPVHRLESLELASYRCHLETRLHQSHLIERELVAVKAFAIWVNPMLGKNLRGPVIQNSPLPANPSKNDETAQPRNIDRYHTVFALADQGFDPAVITAETGLEREAVRLLLTMKPLPTSQDQLN